MRSEAQKIIQNNSEKTEFIEERFAFMRYAGQGHEIKVPIDNKILSNEDAKRIKNSFDPYLSVTFFRYARSGSPSINSVSEDASNLKSFE